MKILKTKRCTLYEAFLQEQHILHKYKEYTFCPAKQIKGWTECLDYSIVDDVIGEL